MAHRQTQMLSHSVAYDSQPHVKSGPEARPWLSPMTAASATVSTAAELVDAIAAGANEIVVQGTISGSPSITLPAGCTLRGVELVFTATRRRPAARA